ncbi:MAG: hypothetical protein WB952_24710 [Terriglobales bacterium]
MELFLNHSGMGGALMKILGWWLLLCWSGLAPATTYYVDPAGSNGNNGLSPQTAWRTLLKVGISTFQPGDVILFKRDSVWNETLTPPSSGTAGNLIKFDAYGSGRPPEFTGYYATLSGQWTNLSGNVWQIALSATQPIPQLNFVQFGTIWGNSRSAQNLLAHDRDWYYDAGAQNLYVWSAGGNPVTHYGSVAPIVLSGQSLINLNGLTYVEIQHIQLDWYDGYGVQVEGASNHLWLANLSADSQVPNGAVPIGFYIHPSGTPGDIHIYNTDAHRNYAGYRFDGTPTAVELTNCRAYANRTYGLLDDSTAPGWKGEYQTWSDFLPENAADVFPGDALELGVPSRGGTFAAIVREVDITVRDIADEHCRYQIKFATDGAQPLAFEFDPAQVKTPLEVIQLTNAQVGNYYLGDLTKAEITEVTSTTLNVDAGVPPLSGGGFEARWSDAGWGTGNDRNLAGRFTTQTFTIPRLSRVQNCYLQQYDGSNPPRYSRYTTALHVDYPL